MSRRDEQDRCEWPGCSRPALCSSGNYGNKLVCAVHFDFTNGTIIDHYPDLTDSIRIAEIGGSNEVTYLCRALSLCLDYINITESSGYLEDSTRIEDIRDKLIQL